MKKVKIQKIYEDFSCGFLVKIEKAPLVSISDEWYLDIPKKDLYNAVLKALISKTSRLSGNEIHFIRFFTELTLKEFGEKFDVSHAAVKNWEDSRNRATDMKWPIEKDIRLFVATKILKNSADFLELYGKLASKADDQLEPITIIFDPDSDKD